MRPQPLESVIGDEIFDQVRPMSELRARTLQKEVLRLARQGAIPEFMVQILLAGLSHRARWHDTGVSHARQAVDLHRSWQTLNTYAVALMDSGQHEEAIRVLGEAVEEEGGYSLIVLANLSEALAVRGDYEGARDVLSRAFEIADFENVTHLRGLADAAGALDDVDLAVSLAARIVARLQGVDVPADPVAFLTDAPAEWVDAVDWPTSVVRAIFRLQALREADESMDRPSSDEDDEAVTVAEYSVSLPGIRRAMEGV